MSDDFLEVHVDDSDRSIEEPIDTQQPVSHPSFFRFTANSACLVCMQFSFTDTICILARDLAFSLPIINAPAHEWTTLVTSLDQLCKLNELVCGSDRKLTVTFDMDLYKRVLKLPYLDSRYADSWVVCPEAFHTELCALRCLGKTIE